MKNKTDIDALEKAVDFIGQYDGNLHDFHDELLVCRAFIHQYKQEIHIAVEDVPPVYRTPPNKDGKIPCDCCTNGLRKNTITKQKYKCNFCNGSMLRDCPY